MLRCDNLIEIAKIQFISSKNCFILIPRQWNIDTSNNICMFKLQSLRNSDSPQFYMSWNGEFSSNDNVQINGVYGSKLNLRNYDDVSLTFVKHNSNSRIANCEKCYLKPLTDCDWEILSLNANFIENHMLNQIRLININQTFPLWINEGNICIFVSIYNVIPQNLDATIITTFTELIVTPSVEDSSLHASNDTRINEYSHETNDRHGSSSVFSSMINAMKSLLSADQSYDDKINTQINNHMIKIHNKLNVNEILRVYPYDESNNNINCVFISHLYFEYPKEKYFAAKLINCLSPYERYEKIKKKNEEKKSDSELNGDDQKVLTETEMKETHVIVFPYKNCSKTNILIPESLRRQMGLSIASRVILKSLLVNEIPIISKINVSPFGVSSKISTINSELIIEELENLITKSMLNFIFLCRGTLIKVLDIDFIVNYDFQTPYICLNHDSLIKLEVQISPPIIGGIKCSWNINLPLIKINDIDEKVNFKVTTNDHTIGGADNLISKCLSFLTYALNLNDLAKVVNNSISSKPISLLIFGPKGCGKSSILNNVINELKRPPNYVYVNQIDCKTLKGKRIDSLEKSWTKSVFECLHRQPSVVIFENLDIIAAAPSKPEQELSSESVYYERIALLFINLIKLIENVESHFGNDIAIVATGKSKKAFHASLIESRGRHIFNEFVEVLPPNLDQRMEILSVIMKCKLQGNSIDIESCNLREISLKCEGYLPIDLTALVERAIHNCMLRTNGSESNFLISKDDFECAFQGFSPISLRDANLHMKSSRKFTDIGGLNQVKKTLMETLLWPCKYPHLYSKLPLKQQSCILLYGAPGTGKTLLVEAVANECDINFISVKGPELLSKYIGASEAAVRDLFIRAECAKPCIVFFDEFDAIAPRRGHDSTGVTDRVVNQLLTQMDGVEALQSGVYVLASSSRPDLLDPALLRPGRFDKCLYCPLPDESERFQILRALSQKLSFGRDADLKAIAYVTQHFTGADLQALLYTAQLEALHESISNKKQINEYGQNKRNDYLLEDESTEFTTYMYMPSVRHGFSKCLTVSERNHLSSEMDIIKSNLTQDLYDHSQPIEFKRSQSADEFISIHQRHILTALNTTKPSVNETEKKRYEQIYDAFRSNRGQSFQIASEVMEKKVTLA